MRHEAIEMGCAHIGQGREPPPHRVGVLGASELGKLFKASINRALNSKTVTSTQWALEFDTPILVHRFIKNTTSNQLLIL